MGEQAEKLLAKMRQSQSSWKRNDIESLYLAFGFTIRHGSKHDIVTHPQYPELRTTLPRHNKLAMGYVRTAVKLVDQLKQKQQEENDNER